MFEFQSALFGGDQLLQAIADDAPAPGGGLTRISRTQNRRDPAVRKVQLALLDWRPDCLPRHRDDGDYGDETAGAVRTFKVEELGVPPEDVIDDVGPLTVQRLDAIRAAAEAPPPVAVGVVGVFNQYGEPLAGVVVSADDGSAAATDEQGFAALALGGPAQVALDQASVLAALGDLLDRPADSAGAVGVVVTPNALASLTLPLGPDERIDVVVVARVDLPVELRVPLEGSPRVEGPGVRVTLEGETVRLALQACGGETATIVLDPPPSDALPAELPPLGPWVAPNGYVVQDGDTEAVLADRFLDDEPEGFAQLSDHPPVPGETLALPPQAIPGWLTAVTRPLPEPPGPRTWATVAPDALLAILFEEGADPEPLHELIPALQAPPAAGEDPLAVLAARAESVAAFLALGPDAGVAASTSADTDTEG